MLNPVIIHVKIGSFRIKNPPFWIFDRLLMENGKNKFFCCCFLTSCDITHRFRGLQEHFEKKISIAHLCYRPQLGYFNEQVS